MKHYVPVVLLLLMGCRTHSSNLLLGTWRARGSTNTIEFYQGTVVLAPILKVGYAVRGSKLILQKPSGIVIDNLVIVAYTNRTDVKELRSHTESPYTDWIVPFHVTPQELEITWDGKTTSYLRVTQ
jgi:hypothetical protein